MHRLASLVLSVPSLTASCAAYAQDALDRLEPSRAEQQKFDRLDEVPEDQVNVDPTVEGATHGGDAVNVGAIEIVGLTELSNADFADIVQEHIGQSLAPSQVSTLTEQLAVRARSRFPLATVRVAPQDVDGGILQVDIDEGRVDRIKLDGFANRHVQAILGTLVTGRPVTAFELERAILVARDAAGVSIREATIRQEAGRNVLVAKGSFNRFRGRLTLDNDTITPIGPFEALAYAEANGVLGDDDTLQASALLALPEPEELGFGRVRYAKRVGKRGAEVAIAASYSRSRPGSYLAPFGIQGVSRSASIGVVQPLTRLALHSLWLEATLSFRELQQDRQGQPARLDQLSLARLGLFGTARVLGGSLRAGATASQGLDIIAGGRSAGTVRSRPDADGTFTTLLLTAQWKAQLAGPWGVEAAVRTQLASRPLLVSEEIGLGGAAFARGYDYSERSGDQGTMGYLEVSYNLDRKVGPFDSLKPYIFVDGGVVRNLEKGRGGGSLLSAGGGIRFDVDRWTDAAFEIAAPLSGNRYETDSTAPRIRVSLTRHF